MTVTTTTSSNGYTANGVLTSFAYTFKIFADADLEVILLETNTGTETTQTLTTHYTVTNAGNANGGNVVFVTAPASGYQVKIRRVLDATQETDYVENDTFPAEAHEDALDKLTMLVQQQSVDKGLAISFPQGDVGAGLNNILPSAVDRASQFLTFDGSGNVSVAGLDSISELTLETLTMSATAPTIPKIIVPNSTNSPIIQAETEAGTGISFTGGSEVGLYVDSGSIFLANENYTRSSVPFRSASGSVASPGLTFGSASDTGFSYSNDQVFFSMGGTQKLKITANLFDLDTQLINLSGIAINGSAMSSVSSLNVGDVTTTGHLNVTDDFTLNGQGANDITWEYGTHKLVFKDNVPASFGTDQDVDVYFNGTNLYISNDVNINGTLEFDGFKFGSGNTITAIHDQDSMSANDSTGLATQQSIKAYVDTQVALYDSLEEILANGNTTGSYDLNVNSGGSITLDDARPINFDYSSSTVFVLKSTTDGIKATGTKFYLEGDLELRDDDKILIGQSDDLQLYHDQNNSYIVEGGTGSLRIQGSAIEFKNAAGTSDIAVFTGSQGAQLFYNNSEKFATSSSGASVTGNLSVSGDLTVSGTTTTVNSTTVTVDDPVFTLGGDTAPSSDDNKDRGIEFRWHDGTNAKIGFFGFDDSTGKFTFIPDATNAGEVFSGSTGTITANLEGNADTATTASFFTGLSDPNADRLLMWDDSAGAHAYVSLGTGLSLSGTTLSGVSAANDATITLSAGTGLSGGGDFTTDQSSAETVTFSLNHLGIESLTDPGADRIYFWDDSANATKFLTVGSNLTLSGTTLTGTAAANDATITLSAGDALSGGGSFTTDQSAAATVTFNVDLLGIEDLTAPAADRIAFYDHGAAAFAWLEAGSNLTISGTTISATNTTYTAGTGLSLSGTEFAIDTAVVARLDQANEFSYSLYTQEGQQYGFYNASDTVVASLSQDAATDLLVLRNFSQRVDVSGDGGVRLWYENGSTINNYGVEVFNLSTNVAGALNWNGNRKIQTNGAGVSVVGSISVTGTVDGVDIATRDGVLTTTTTTANAALPKAGGTMTGGIRLDQDNLTASGSTLTIDLSASNNFKISITANTTFAFSNKDAGRAGNIIVVQDATGGHSFTLPSECKTPVGGASIVQSTGANELSLLSYYVVDSSTIIVNYIGDFA